MPIKYIPYEIKPLRGQAVLPFLRYHGQSSAKDFQLRGMPYFEVDLIEKINQKGNQNSDNLVIHGDCLNACAYLKENNIKVDLVYIDPPFASGANYAKKIYIRQNPKLAAKLTEAEEKLETESEGEIDNTDLQAFEETMYGDIWQKENYLNWLYERLLAIKEIMSENSSIYVHLDWNIGHYVKVLLDEIFGEENFINELIWNKGFRGTESKDIFQHAHETIFYYSKTHSRLWDQQRTAYKDIDMSRYNQEDEKGKFALIKRVRTNGEVYYGKTYYNPKGKKINDVLDVPTMASTDTQRTDYSTQKPEDLLKIVIKTSSKEGLIVADLFGGSGVTAKVANDLGCKFITADVGINAIQTIRDRLIEAKANFDILKIRDGIDLFRNPQQTMEKLAHIIPGVSSKHDFGPLWFGAMADKGEVCPCWVPNLLDKSQAILNKAIFSKILDETAKLEGVSKVIICSIDRVDEDEIVKMIKDYDLRDSEGKHIEFVFKDLKELIDLLVSPDNVEYSVTEKDGRFIIVFERFISDHLMQRIDEFNAKRKVSQKQIEISEEGLELIEYISVDCTNNKDVWKSDHEIKIDKKGYMIMDGKKTTDFWDGTIAVDKKPFRLKIRNIAGDELVLSNLMSDPQKADEEIH